MNVRVRFAPSPTGHLHVGGARTALFNWLFARHHGGRFIVRIEDTDVARSTAESEAMVLEDLRWLGLTWDEGPEVGGPHGPYRQSERRAIYSRAGATLVATGHAYRCFCEEGVLERKRQEAERAGRPPHYDLTCHRLPPDEVYERTQRGDPFVVRFHVPKEEGATLDADVTIHDLIRGEVSWKKESLGDFIVIRSDGMPTYNFSVAVDDHEMEITHVIRAEEHLTNTHRQVLIYRALGWEVPQFAHVSLILGADRTKLSKRHGATSVASFAEDGFLADAMVNYLTLLGWSSPDGKEIFSRQEAIASFSFDRVNAAPAVFDPQKFEWVNAQYIHHADPASLIPYLRPHLHGLGWIVRDTEEVDRWLVEVLALVQTGATRIHALIPSMQFLFEFDVHTILEQEENRTILGEEGTSQLLEVLLQDLRTHGAPDSPEQYQQMTGRLKEASGVKGKKLFMPIRVALTGWSHGPELQTSIPLLQRATSVDGLGPIVSPVERVERLLRQLTR